MLIIALHIWLVPAAILYGAMIPPGRWFAQPIMGAPMQALAWPILWPLYALVRRWTR